MGDPTGPAPTRTARELLTATVAFVASSVYQRCEQCGALVPTSGQVQHRRWHDAVTVLAVRVFGPGQ